MSDSRDSSSDPAESEGALPQGQAVGLGQFQRLIEAIYFRKDRERGLEGTYMWFAEEIGELTRALRRDSPELEEEFADVLAWLSTLASIKGIDLEQAVRNKYGEGCPYCGAIPCQCT